MSALNLALKNILTYVLFAIFLYTAISKTIHYDKFLNELEKSPLIPLALSKVVSHGVILSEIALAIILMVKQTNLIAILLSGILLLVFTVYIFMILIYSPYVPCSCGGIVSQLSWTQHLVLNISLFLCCAYCYYLGRKSSPL